jgi:hypothetical protein
MQWIVFLVAVAMLLGLSKRVLGGSTRMSLIVVVSAALGGLFLITLR